MARVRVRKVVDVSSMIVLLLTRAFSSSLFATSATSDTDTAGEVDLSDVSQGSQMGRARLGARLLPMPS